MLRALLIAAYFALTALPLVAQPGSIEWRTEGMRRIEGYLPLYWDNDRGRLFLELTRFETELLYQVSLATGVGSSPLGLDRGRLGATRVVRFQRVGPRVLMIEPNYRYRAITTDTAERRSVTDSFAQSVTWGFEVEATSGPRVLVDATEFFLRDANAVSYTHLTLPTKA